ncbi:MAG: minor capsid protein [Candidatus Gastranaerophilales bacterium]|nr:minor capsid protein [Candidatus Gastranaerophilales bacterium]
MAEFKGLFKLAPAQAIKYFKNKNNALSWDWYEIWQDAHKKSFTVAKVMREDILEDIRSAVDKALSEGKTFQEFQKELKPTLQKKGWWGDEIVVDTKGNAEKVQLGSMHRLKTIYSVNMQTAYQTGRYKTQMDNVDNRPYWEYVAVMDASTRPEHAELNGLIFRYDDPFWNSFYPPNGWRCRCRVNALSSYKLQKKKVKPSSSSGLLSQEDRLVSKKSGEYKPVAVYTDPLTGHKISTDVGWSHNPASGLNEQQ